MLTDRIDRFEDLFDNRWTRKGAYQLLSYMWAMSEEHGLMVLDRPGIPKVLPVSLFANEAINLKRVEQFLSLAFTAVEFKNKGTLPDYIKEVDTCKACSFLGSHCQPPLLAGVGAQVFTDEALAQALDRRGELLSSASEFEKLDKQIKAQLRGVEMGVAGNWLIEGKFGKNTTLVFPDEVIKKQYQVTDPKGKFTLKLTRLGTEKAAEDAA